MVFDVTSRASFDALDGWLEESQKFGLNTQQIVVCANKVCMRPCHGRGRWLPSSMSHAVPGGQTKAGDHGGRGPLMGREPRN